MNTTPFVYLLVLAIGSICSCDRPFPMCDSETQSCEIFSCTEGEYLAIVYCIHFMVYVTNKMFYKLNNMPPCSPTTVPISFSRNTGYQSPAKAVCVDNSSPASFHTSYHITGCPIGFFNTLQNTSGVCWTKNDRTGMDLLLRSSEMVPGLHAFDCLVHDHTKIEVVSSHAIVGKCMSAESW